MNPILRSLKLKLPLAQGQTARPRKSGLGIALSSLLISMPIIGLMVTASNADPLRTAMAATGPFAGLGGSWMGSGVVKLKDGVQEHIRCRGDYDVDASGISLRQELRCASDSYKFEMSTNLSEVGGQLRGSWSENTRHVAGHVTGSANGATMRARAEGDMFTALFDVNTHGDRQSVTISSPGSAISEVSIALTRAGR
jgi:hypothetical protein